VVDGCLIKKILKVYCELIYCLFYGREQKPHIQPGLVPVCFFKVEIFNIIPQGFYY